jgi:hypothetical protein
MDYLPKPYREKIKSHEPEPDPDAIAKMLRACFGDSVKIKHN